MIRRIAILSLMLSLTAVAGCSKQGTNEVSGPGPVVTSFGGLHIGDQIAISAIGATLHFENVLSDSRCPEDAVCVWEGNAQLAMFLVDSRGVTIPFHLNSSSNVPPSLGKAKFEYLGYEFSIGSLQPRRRTDREIPPEDYELEVSATPIAR